MIRKPASRRRGIALLFVLGCLVVFAMLASLLMGVGLNEARQARVEERRVIAGWLAESGLERAWARLATTPDYTGETWTLTPETLGVSGSDDAIITISVEPVPDAPDRRRVRSQADCRSASQSQSHARSTRVAEMTLPVPMPSTVSGDIP